VVRALTADPENRVPHLAFQPDKLDNAGILAMDEIETAYYLRMQVADQPGVMADVTRILADQSISIEAIIQKEPQEAGPQTATIIMLTHVVKEKNMNAAIAAIEKLECNIGDVTRIRMENLGK
jgi:homoserine dehydrogenase